MSKAKIMFNMTVREVRDGLSESKTVIVPVGVVEQHGYHLPLSVDIHNAVEIANRTSERTGCFVAPCVQYSFSGGMLPGTINIAPQTFSLVVMDICKSLITQGFKNVVFLLGHGGTENTQAARDAALLFQRLNPEIDDVCLAVVPALGFSKTCDEAYKEGDFHAGKFETSLMLYWKPELVQMKHAALDTPEFAQRMRMDQDAYLCKTMPVENEYVVPKLTQSPEMNVGVMGDYIGASAEYGRKIVEESVNGLADMIDELESRILALY